MCVYLYIQYIINIHSTHIHILCEQKLLFWMRLIFLQDQDILADLLSKQGVHRCALCCHNAAENNLFKVTNDVK